MPVIRFQRLLLVKIWKAIYRGCYQKFTKNQEHLKCSITPVDRASTTCTPRKLLSWSDMRLFPSQCIFCEKLELKLQGKTERCVKFPMFKDKDGALKEPTWKQIELRALKLGNSGLHRKVKGEALFARGPVPPVLLQII